MSFLKGIFNFITSTAGDLRETVGNLWSATSHTTVQTWWLVIIGAVVLLYVFKRR